MPPNTFEYLAPWVNSFAHCANLAAFMADVPMRAREDQAEPAFSIRLFGPRRDGRFFSAIVFPDPRMLCTYVARCRREGWPVPGIDYRAGTKAEFPMFMDVDGVPAGEEDAAIADIERFFPSPLVLFRRLTDTGAVSFHAHWPGLYATSASARSHAERVVREHPRMAGRVDAKPYQGGAHLRWPSGPKVFGPDGSRFELVRGDGEDYGELMWQCFLGRPRGAEEQLEGGDEGNEERDRIRAAELLMRGQMVVNAVDAVGIDMMDRTTVFSPQKTMPRIIAQLALGNTRAAIAMAGAVMARRTDSRATWLIVKLPDDSHVPPTVMLGEYRVGQTPASVMCNYSPSVDLLWSVVMAEAAKLNGGLPLTKAEMGRVCYGKGNSKGKGIFREVFETLPFTHATVRRPYHPVSTRPAQTTTINSWTGFDGYFLPAPSPVEAIMWGSGSRASPLGVVLRFHHEILCGNMHRLSYAALAFLACVFRRPAEPSMRMPVYIGAQGSGKSLWLKTIIRAVFGQNSMMTERVGLFTQRFNSLVEDMTLVAVDESKITSHDWSALKYLTTADRATAERKGRDATSNVPISINFICACNSLDDIFIGNQERRPIIIQCANEDTTTAAFAARVSEFRHALADPAFAPAMAWFLGSFLDMRAWEDDIHTTRFYGSDYVALRAKSMTGPERWWRERLESGDNTAVDATDRDPAAPTWYMSVPRAGLYELYRKTKGDGRTAGEGELVDKMRSWGARVVNVPGGSANVCFPSMRESRRRFEEALGDFRFRVTPEDDRENFRYTEWQHDTDWTAAYGHPDLWRAQNTRPALEGARLAASQSGALNANFRTREVVARLVAALKESRPGHAAQWYDACAERRLDSARAELGRANPLENAADFADRALDVATRVVIQHSLDADMDSSSSSASDNSGNGHGGLSEDDGSWVDCAGWGDSEDDAHLARCVAEGKRRAEEDDSDEPTEDDMVHHREKRLRSNPFIDDQAEVDGYP